MATKSSLRPVAGLDLSRYVGVWYEIARLPNRFQTSCTGDVTATYTLLEDGTIEVKNRKTGEREDLSLEDALKKVA